MPSPGDKLETPPPELAGPMREAELHKVDLMADAMRTKLRANAHKGGWEKAHPGWVMDRLEQEREELAAVVRSALKLREKGIPLSPGVKEKLRYEAADVANFAMILVDVLGGYDA